MQNALLHLQGIEMRKKVLKIKNGRDMTNHYDHFKPDAECDMQRAKTAFVPHVIVPHRGSMHVPLVKASHKNGHKKCLVWCPIAYLGTQTMCQT